MGLGVAELLVSVKGESSRPVEAELVEPLRSSWCPGCPGDIVGYALLCCPLFYLFLLSDMREQQHDVKVDKMEM